MPICPWTIGNNPRLEYTIPTMHTPKVAIWIPKREKGMNPTNNSIRPSFKPANQYHSDRAGPSCLKGVRGHTSDDVLDYVTSKDIMSCSAPFHAHQANACLVPSPRLLRRARFEVPMHSHRKKGATTATSMRCSTAIISLDLERGSRTHWS